MSEQANNWNETQYVRRVSHIYQQEGWRLRGMTTAATRFEGAEKAIFRLAGKSVAYEKERRDRNVLSGGDRKTFEVLLKVWKVFDDVDERDMDTMNVDEMEVIYEAGAKALGRATDKAIYDEFATAKTSADVDYSSGAFSAASAFDLCKRLQEQKVPWDGQVYCGLPALQWNQFIANKIVASSDFVGAEGMPYTKVTQAKKWNGVIWFLNVEENTGDFYRVPSANKQDCFIWHKSAIGWASHTDNMRVRRTWDTYYDRWILNMEAKGNAKALQEGNGIVRFTTSSNSAIAVV